MISEPALFLFDRHSSPSRYCLNKMPSREESGSIIQPVLPLVLLIQETWPPFSIQYWLSQGTLTLYSVFSTGYFSPEPLQASASRPLVPRSPIRARCKSTSLVSSMGNMPGELGPVAAEKISCPPQGVHGRALGNVGLRPELAQWDS